MRPILFAALALSSVACVPLRQHQGYIVDVDLVNSVQPGVDNRDSVLATLGKPTIAGQPPYRCCGLECSCGSSGGCWV